MEGLAILLLNVLSLASAVLVDVSGRPGVQVEKKREKTKKVSVRARVCACVCMCACAYTMLTHV